MSKNINITVTEKHAVVEGTPVIVCGNADYTVTFAFDSEWEGQGVKTARFVYIKGGKIHADEKPFTGDTVDVPVLSDTKEVSIGVYAAGIRTTTPARVPCERSILCGGGVHEEPAEDVYLQLLKLLQSMPTVPKTIHVVYEDINGNATLPDAMEWYKSHPLNGCYIGSQTGYSEPILVKSHSQTTFTLYMVEYNYWEMDEENYGDSAYWVKIFDSEYITSKIDEHDKQIGNVDKALASIIAIQNSLIGGESV